MNLQLCENQCEYNPNFKPTKKTLPEIDTIIQMNTYTPKSIPSLRGGRDRKKLLNSLNDPNTIQIVKYPIQNRSILN